MPLEEVSRCPVCQGASFSLLHTSKDFTKTLELFHVKQCNSCSLILTSPRPTASESPHYYQSDAYISHAAKSRSLFDSIYLIVRYLSLKWKFSLVKQFVSTGPILDFGCGTGAFLNKVRSKGLQVYGVEPSASARLNINNEITVSDSIDSLPNTQFEVVTLWHVLEHVYDLGTTIQKLKARLTERGTIFIAVPNWESFDATHYHEYWAAYDVPRHLWHFSKKSMQTLLQNNGLKIQKIVPMKLDAYYVSLLSEKYIHNGSLSLKSIFNALRVGLLSNLKGRRRTNHSSLIFVVQK